MLNKYLIDTLIQEGKRLGIPTDKKRALIREFLQSKIIYLLYNQRDSKKLSFIGGTSLRLLRNLDRFSEDLDFDNMGLTFQKTKAMFEACSNRLASEGFKIEFGFKKTPSSTNSAIGYIKFIDLLFELNISGHTAEKLLIKIDYTTPKTLPETEILILGRFGLTQTVVANTGDFILSQKSHAILTRKSLQPRDIYDFVWLRSHGFKPSKKLFKNMGVNNEMELYDKLLEKYKTIKPQLKSLKKKLQPFLINEENVKYLDIFEKLVKNN